MSCHQDSCSPGAASASASCTYVCVAWPSPNSMGASMPGSYAAACKNVCQLQLL